MIESLYRIHIQREAGLLKQPYRRNPLMAESSPRYPGFKFDFSVPEKKPEPQKWVYPENDWGLMAKFVSQKPIYDEIRNKEENYANIVKEFRKVRQQNEKAFNDALAREIDKKLEVDDPDKSLREEVHEHRIHRQAKDIVSTLNKEDELLLKGIKEHSKVITRHGGGRHNNEYYGSTNKNNDTKQEPVDFYKQKISKIKDLGTTHPDVLEKWRADRAADFISKGGKKVLEPPPPRILSTMPFHPPGNHRVEKEPLSAVRKPKVKSASTQSLGTPSYVYTLNKTISELKTSLRDTKDEIERQKLLIALNTKQKGYEVASGARTSDSL